MYLSSTWYHFLSVKQISFNISCKEVLLATYSLSLFICVMPLFHLHLWRIVLKDVEFMLDCIFLQNFSTPSHCLKLPLFLMSLTTNLIVVYIANKVIFLLLLLRFFFLVVWFFFFFFFFFFFWLVGFFFFFFFFFWPHPHHVEVLRPEVKPMPQQLPKLL